MNEPDWADWDRLMGDYYSLASEPLKNADRLREVKRELWRWAHRNVSFCDGPREYDPAYAQRAQP